jgi:hypothetical protein
MPLIFIGKAIIDKIRMFLSEDKMPAMYMDDATLNHPNYGGAE